jgi:histidine triad (HIT) family protein
MGQETVFSKIIRREIPAQIVFESERVLAFKDISPQAPSHIVIIPKKPLKDVLEAKPEDAALLGELVLAAADIARSMGISQEGFRLVINTGASAGQTVFHLHMHLLGGRPLSWPPG